MIKLKNFNQDLKIHYDQAKLTKFCKNHGISLLILHGSYVRGHAVKRSDIDVGLLRDEYRKKESPWNIIHELHDVFGDKVDVVFLNHAETMIVKNVALFGIPLYEQQKGLFNIFKTTAISSYQDAFKFRELEKIYLKRHIGRRRAS